MKNLIVILIMLVSMTAQAQFTFNGYKGKTVINKKKPNSVYYYTGGKTPYKQRETYLNWEPHFLRLQELGFNEDGSVEKLSEMIAHYADFSDELIEKMIKQGENAFKIRDLTKYNGYYFYPATGKKSTVQYYLSIELSARVFPSFIFGSDGTLSSAQFDNMQYYFDTKEQALSFFTTLKDKKFDSMLDLTDAPKRITTTYVAYTSEALETEKIAQKKKEAAEAAANPKSKISTGGSITIGGKTYYKYKNKFYNDDFDQVCKYTGSYEFGDKTEYKTSSGMNTVVSKNGNSLFYNDTGTLYLTGSKTAFMYIKNGIIYRNGSKIGTNKAVSSTDSDFFTYEVAILADYFGF